MNSTFSLLLVFLARLFMPRHNAQMRLLKAQIHILRARIPTQRIILSPAEKSELLRIGAECGHEIDGLMEVAKPATYKRWLAQMRGGRPFEAVAPDAGTARCRHPHRIREPPLGLQADRGGAEEARALRRRQLGQARAPSDATRNPLCHGPRSSGRRWTA